MTTDQFQFDHIFPVTPERIFNDWLSSEAHSAMTGGEAEIDNLEATAFMAWDGYISGTVLELINNKRIIMSWRTTEFPLDQADSIFEIKLTQVDEGTKVTFTHTNLALGDGDKYLTGWKDHYVAPMTEYYAQ